MTLSALTTGCRLTIDDIGDALPADREAIFKPFVTHKSLEARDGSLGRELFVARTIVGHHRGSLLAEPQPEAVGARFIADLPLASKGSSPNSLARNRRRRRLCGPAASRRSSIRLKSVCNV